MKSKETIELIQLEANSGCPEAIEEIKEIKMKNNLK